MTGAVIFRRSRNYWCIDEFDENGKYLGGIGGNHSSPRLVGWRDGRIEWPEEIVRLDALDYPFAHTRPPKRAGLTRFSR